MSWAGVVSEHDLPGRIRPHEAALEVERAHQVVWSSVNAQAGFTLAGACSCLGPPIEAGIHTILLEQFQHAGRAGTAGDGLVAAQRLRARPGER